MPPPPTSPMILPPLLTALMIAAHRRCPCRRRPCRRHPCNVNEHRYQPIGRIVCVHAHTEGAIKRVHLLSYIAVKEGSMYAAPDAKYEW